eukprot:CFRG3853T1
MGAYISQSKKADATLLQPAMGGDLVTIKTACETIKESSVPNSNAVTEFVNTQDPAGNAAIHGAVFGGHLEIVEYLHSQGNCSLTLANGIGCSPLWLAAGYGHVDILNYILGKLEENGELDAQIAMTNNTGDTPMLAAASKGNSDAVEILLNATHDKHNALSAQNQGGDTPLAVAVAGGHSDVVKCLLDQGSNINSLNKKNLTPLLVASERGHHKIVNTLVNHGADCNVVDSNGATALAVACFCGNVEVAEVLLKLLPSRLLLNTPDELGCTPLWLAAKQGNLTLVKILSEAGADRTLKGDEGLTSAEIAAKAQKKEVADYLNGKVEVLSKKEKE